MSLEPVRKVVIGAAQAQAEKSVSTARDRAGELLRTARRQAEDLLAQAREEGRGLALQDASRVLVEERERASELVLAARREVWNLLQSEVLAQVNAIRETPRYAVLLDELEATARTQLGPGALIVRDPAAGGIIATLGDRSVDYTLPAMAERCIEDSPAAELWT